MSQMPEWLLIAVICVAWIQGGFIAWSFSRHYYQAELSKVSTDLQEVAKNANIIYEQLQRYEMAEQMLRQVVLTPRSPSDPTLLN